MHAQEVTAKARWMLFLNTLAFTVCFAAWMINGVLVTFLSERRVFDWGSVETGWLMGIPVLTGAIFRLPAGILTDKFGGKFVLGGLLIFCALPMFLLSKVNSFTGYALCSFGFGLAGVSFAIGVAFSSVWYPKKWQGTALGIFGAGNAGAALTTLIAPSLLDKLTKDGEYLEGWRQLPVIYASILLGMGGLFLIFATNRKPQSGSKTLVQLLAPLKHGRVWRFGLYYFLVFGCFVAFSQWLVPYFVNVYFLPLVTAGFFAALFSFPSGVIRILGGWMSDKFGPRKVMYWVLGSSVIISLLLSVPKMEIISPGKGVIAQKEGTVTVVAKNEIKVDDYAYPLARDAGRFEDIESMHLVLPVKDSWQEPIVKVGDQVARKDLLAKGVTKIFFQANVWVFVIFAIVIGCIWGMGAAAVYKHISDYYPEEVGVVGGMVGVLGGLGGFFCPIIFGYLLEGTGIWTSCWMFIFLLSLACLIWMHRVVERMMHKKHPNLMRRIEAEEP
jgi:NNP family nitrate/nitrite transporter-like MFS transporter